MSFVSHEYIHVGDIFPILRMSKEAMGGNELLKVKKVKCWMAETRSDQGP